MLNEKQVELIVKELIKAGDISIGKYSGLFNNIEQFAIKLGYIQELRSNRMESKIDLEEEDYLKVQDKIWELVLEGFLSPGKNMNNPWFPKLHFTKKGKQYKKTLIKEEEKEN